MFRQFIQTKNFIKSLYFASTFRPPLIAWNNFGYCTRLYSVSSALFLHLPGKPLTETNDQQLYLENMKALGLSQVRIKLLVDHSVTIDILAEDPVFMNATDLIQQFCRKEDINLLVMGVSEK